MRRTIILILTLKFALAVCAQVQDPVSDLLNRIGGKGSSDRIVAKVVPDLAMRDQDGRSGQGGTNCEGECFVIRAEGGKPLIEGSSLNAVTTGVGWYLNHYAHKNLSWNILNECGDNAYLSLDSLPVPERQERHVCQCEYRYYFNYCTFGYSMMTWTWERWQKEIDWMALHGINMPLQIVGIEAVWRNLLKDDYGYTDQEAKAFVPGPAYTAWWGMNNLQEWGGTDFSGWGGVQDDVWYARQQQLCAQILNRERELGMQPVLPGFSGMVPSNFEAKTGIASLSQGGWCGFTRPYILDPLSPNFESVAANYYKRLAQVMGTSQYYSMDPFHEGDGTCPTSDAKRAYYEIYSAMNRACSGSQFVIQQWQWAPFQAEALHAVPEGRLIVLDLFSDGKPTFDNYNGYAPQDAIYCTIPNFGGRSGLMGRLDNLCHNYFVYKNKYKSIKGVGAAPEAIEQTPVSYDLLFELPWMDTEPDMQTWIHDYVTNRYGVANTTAQEAWDLLRQSALNYGSDAVQGPVEDVWACRPNLELRAASSWGKTLADVGHIYTPDKRRLLRKALQKLLSQSDSLWGSNYLYDIVEIGSAVLADLAFDMLTELREAKASGDQSRFDRQADEFLQLILDVDSLKGTNINFRVGKWTQEARLAAKEAEALGATAASADWYELQNARTLITTWGDEAQSGTQIGRGLHDYSYRSWQGLMRDVYYRRWHYWLKHNCQEPPSGWFCLEWDWAHRMRWQPDETTKSSTPLAPGERGYTYTAEPQGNTVSLAKALMNKYQSKWKHKAQ